MENFNKGAWTGVNWVSKKIHIKEYGSNLGKIVKDFDSSLESLIDYRPGPRSEPEEVHQTGASNVRPKPRPGSRSSSRTSSNYESSTDDSEPIGDSQCPGPSRKRKRRDRPTRPVPKCSRSKHGMKIVCRPSPQPRIDIDEEIIKQLGFDEELDLGLGRGSCFVMSSVLGRHSGKSKEDDLKISLDLHLGVDLDLKEAWKLIPEDSQLKTVEIRKQAYVTERKRRNCGGVKYKETTIQTVMLFDPKANADLFPNETVLVVVRIYLPHTLKHKKRYLRDPKFSQEVVMLSTQTLDLLRDQIVCVADTVVPGECSANPRHVPDHTAKDVYKSGFFFINDAFYNDFRHPDNIDYSEVVRLWAAKRGMGELSRYAMESTRMEELTVRLGYPYLYQHQGNCEHLLTISDVRLLHPSESRLSTVYPYVIHHARPRMQLCFMCGKFAARWLTEDNLRVPFNPCYFCDRCFHSFNYIDGQKVGSFKAYYFREPIFIH